MTYRILVGKKRFNVDVTDAGSGIVRVTVDGEPYDVTIENYAEVSGAIAPASARPQPATAPVATASVAPSVEPAAPEPRPAARPAPGAAAAGTPVRAPLPGVVVSVKVAVGDVVVENQTVVTIEAMKMENNIAATASGVVKQILVSPGSLLNTGDLIMVIG